MDLECKTTSNGFIPEINLDKLHKTAVDLVLPVKFVLRLLSRVLVFVTNLLSRILSSSPVKQHFHLMLSGLILFGPLLSLWVSKYSIFANKHHFLYRKFLQSAWGWTCILAGSFVLLVSFSARRSLSLSLRHVSRIASAAALWWGCRRLLSLMENASGTCYEPMAAAKAGSSLLLLHEDQGKASCLKAGMVWRGYEVSENSLVLCLCCLLLVEELSVFGPLLAREKVTERSPGGGPLRALFLLCTVLLSLWMFLLLCQLAHFQQFPSQQLGGALAYLGWRGLYQGWYRLKHSPGLPGEGLLIDDDDEDKQIEEE